jgi:histone H3/H4
MSADRLVVTGGFAVVQPAQVNSPITINVVSTTRMHNLATEPGVSHWKFKSVAFLYRYVYRLVMRYFRKHEKPMMKALDLAPIRRKLADLADSPATSDALRSYLSEALRRDTVDVMNEIDVLARLCASRAKREGKP